MGILKSEKHYAVKNIKEKREKKDKRKRQQNVEEYIYIHTYYILSKKYAKHKKMLYTRMAVYYLLYCNRSV